MKDYTKYQFSSKKAGTADKSGNDKTELKKCRDCGSEVSRQARICPSCGAPDPWKSSWNGYGFEYKSRAKLFGIPLLHVSFKYLNRMPVPAVGIISVGQVGLGIINISQFGLGIFSVHQFGIAGISISQFTISCTGITQLGIFIFRGIGQITMDLMPEVLAPMF
ncbi:hypothetical protein SMSP2_02698 [Limihaloglobus sulfuriphilus]|uniref:Zinc-ribbon domain-containing protein n=1 Tax=Limihaloglobus sulfuriphilus TaxID=1851148 RepID=A0A1Q2MHY3_9BACT|nr:hydrogenase maturation nickel metallochaperone HypA [Limihaloglobus sulfuriphilus]AQQ72315.1 hypothetical protein SMSP2_02698 [Limihaloglobus sulfuriphilus]